MKPLVVTVLLFGCVASASASPSPSSSFHPAILRQDFTGQGTYHRIGLLREQNRAVAASRTAQTDPPASPGFISRIWQTFFPARSDQPKTQAP